MDVLDDLLGPAEDPIESADANSRGGALVVPGAAPDGKFLEIEAQTFREIAHLPLVLFEEEHEDGTPMLANSRELQDAMNVVSPPSVQEALDWIIGVLVANFERHRERLATAYEEAIARAPKTRAPDPAAVPTRARMPHSTGHVRTFRGWR